MASLSMLRISRGSCLSKAFSSKLFVKNSPTSSCLLQKKAITLSPVACKRIYGPPEAGGHSNTNHWKIERAVAVGLLPVIPMSLLFPNMALDFALSTFLVLHTHWGLSGVATDYIHGEVIPKILQPTILLLSILAFAGLSYLNYNDIGFGKAVQLLWKEL